MRCPLSDARIPRNAEWLETDRLGGFASGTVRGVRTRRHDGLLHCATTPHTARVSLGNGLEPWLETHVERFALSNVPQRPPDAVLITLRQSGWRGDAARRRRQ